MAKPAEPYVEIWVESYEPAKTGRLHGSVHVRPTADSCSSTKLRVSCSKSFSRNYLVGARFRIRAKLNDREAGGKYLYSPHWKPLAIQRP